MRALPGITFVLILAAVVATAAWLSFRPTQEPPPRPDDGGAPVARTPEPVPEDPLEPDDPGATGRRDARVPPPVDLPLSTIEVLLSEGETERALGALAPWVAREPSNPKILRMRGRAWLDQQNWRRAERDFARAGELEGDDVTATSLDGRAEALTHLRKIGDARKLLLRSLELFPDRARPHSLLALGYLNEGNRKAARAEIDRARDLDPTEPLANGLLKRLDTSPR